MARRPKYEIDVTGKGKVPFGFKLRNGVYYVRFPNPADPGRYTVTTTERTTEGEAYRLAAEIVVKAYAPDDHKRATKADWKTILADLESTSGLRPTTLATYQSIVGQLREYVPAAKGPGDITPEVAQRFRTVYGGGTYSRSNKSTAKRYKRSAKTVENAVRRLSGLWSKYLQKHGYAVSNPWVNIARPTVPKKAPKPVDEETVAEFLTYTRSRYPDWPLIHAVLAVKMLAGCRTQDACSLRSADLNGKDKTITIRAEADKTHRERVVPLPDDLFKTIGKLKGETYLWEQYTQDAKRFRPGTRNRDPFDPKTLAWAVSNLFREFNESRPGKPKLLPHDLRRRAITLTVMATGGNVDATAQAIGIDPSTARKHYLDAKKAFDSQELLKRMAGVLRPGT